MNSDECIVISDEEEETPDIYEANSNDQSKDSCSNICMPEFVSVPSISTSHMQSELDYVPKLTIGSSLNPSNFVEITESELKKNIRKNDLVIKIDGSLNPSNMNAIMSVIDMYDFKKAGKVFFVKNTNPNVEIDVNKLICHETITETSTGQENRVPQRSQKRNSFSESSYWQETQPGYVQPQTGVNLKLREVVTVTHRKYEKKTQKIVNKTNRYHQNTQEKHEIKKLKPFHLIGETSHQVVETATVGHVDNDHTNQTQRNINRLSELLQNIQKTCNRVKPFNQIAETSPGVIETSIGHVNNDHVNQINMNELSGFQQNTQENCYRIRLKPFNQIANAFHQVDEHMQYAVPPSNLNQFSKNLQEDHTNDEPIILQNPSNAARYSPVSEYSSNPDLLKVAGTKCGCSVGNKRKKKNKVRVQKINPRKKKNLKSFYRDKYKLKEVRIALSRLEVENYFKIKKLKQNLSFSEQSTSSNINQIFIHDHNFESMMHHYCNKTPPNTQLYFVNKHNITTSLYMKNFPLFEKAIKTNKIKVISESTYKKYRSTRENKLISSPNNYITKAKTERFCRLVSDFHHSCSIEQNPFLKSIQLDHSYSVRHKLI